MRNNAFTCVEWQVTAVRSRIAQFPLRRLSLKLLCRESRAYKPSRYVEIIATKSVTSLQQIRLCRCNEIFFLQRTGKVGDNLDMSIWFLSATFTETS